MARSTLSRRGDTAMLTIDRPPVNAVELETIEELAGHMERLAHSPPAGGLVVTGAGAAFCAGLDFKIVPAYDAARLAAMARTINRTAGLLYGLPVPTVAAVNGHAMGGGLVLALACDLRIAAKGGGLLALAEVTAGIPYPAVPMEIVLAELEPNLRRRLTLTGAQVTMDDALRLGLADAAAEPAALLDEAVARAQALAALPAYAAIKDQLKRGTISRIQTIIDTDDDPVVATWRKILGR